MSRIEFASCNTLESSNAPWESTLLKVTVRSLDEVTYIQNVFFRLVIVFLSVDYFISLESISVTKMLEEQ